MTMGMPITNRVILLLFVYVFGGTLDRKSTRLNSSHVSISYAVFCLKKKKQNDACSGDHKGRPVRRIDTPCPGPITTMHPRNAHVPPRLGLVTSAYDVIILHPVDADN